MSTTQKLTAEQIQEIRDCFSSSTTQLAKKFGVSKSTVYRAKMSLAGGPLRSNIGTITSPVHPVPAGFELRRVSSQLADDGSLKSQWLGSRPLQGDHMDTMPEGAVLLGTSTLLGPDGRVTSQWVKTKVAPPSDEDIIAGIMERLPQKVTSRVGSIRAPKVAKNDSLFTVYPLGDPHIGMMAWGEETGTDFDLKIAEETMVGAMHDLVLRGPRTEEALIVNLGDYFHFDNQKQETTRGGHRMETDSRPAKVLAVGLRIMTGLIDAALKHHQKVTVDCRIGNHDAHSSLMLSLALGAYYRNEPRVHVPPTLTHRAYHQFGKVMIMTTHGDKAKIDSLESIMATEQPKMWGETEHRYALTGHIHHSTRKEFRGVIVESFRTLAGKDAWHSEQGYMSGRDATRIVYHREHGEMSREVCNVSQLLRQCHDVDTGGTPSASLYGNPSDK